MKSQRIIPLGRAVWIMVALLATARFLHASDNVVVITLEEAVFRAMGLNNRVRASEFALKKAAWERGNAWTQLLPAISFNTRVTRIDDQSFAERDFRRYLPPELADQIPQTVFQRSYFTSFDATVPVFNGFLLNNLRLSRAGYQMAGYLSKSTRENIVYQVVRTYLDVLKGQEIRDLQEDYLELSRRNYEKAVRMEQAGRYSRTEMLRWKVDYQQQKSILAGSQSALRSHQTMLYSLLNMDMEMTMRVEGQIPQWLSDEAARVSAMKDDEILEMIALSDIRLTQRNAALAAAGAGMTTSKLAYQGQYASFMPNVTASYSYGWRENNTIELDDYSPTMLMVNVSIPVFTSFQNTTAVKASYYAYRESVENFQDQLKNTRFMMTDAANRLINLKIQRELSRANAEYSANNYRIAEQQKEKGLVSNIEFIDAKLNWQDARLLEISTDYDFISTLIELYYLLGRLESLIDHS